MREFEYSEFEAALKAVFPQVHLWSQNHSEAIAFVPAAPSGEGVLNAPADAVPEHAHFFLAACSRSPIADTRSFAWLPSAGNVLRERQRHIALLESELTQKNAWLADAVDSLARVQKEHDSVLSELQDRNAWAARLNGELDVTRALVSRMESEAAVRLDWIRGVEAQNRDLESQIARGRTEIERQRRENDEQETIIVERTQWAQNLDAELERLRAELRAIKDAKWVRLGRNLHVISGKPE